MAEASRNPGPATNWRFALAVGLPIGVAVPVSRELAQALDPSLGHWGAFLVSLLAAAATGALTALAAAWILSIFGRRGGENAEPGPPANRGHS